MSEILPNVYDLIYPSPVDLKEISSIAVAVALWRRELNQYRVSGNLIDFQPKLHISLEKVIPNIPSAINCTVAKYIKRFGNSLGCWIAEHFYRVFKVHRGHPNDVLNDFNDFVFDCDGTINNVRTAKRMICCDQLSDVEKFTIACMYCFENEVQKIWPSVSERIDLKETDFIACPQLFYWVSWLRSGLHEIPNPYGVPIDELMFQMSASYNSPNLSSLEYFWNRINSENRLERVMYLSMNEVDTFVRFFLPKLNEQELDRFVVEQGSELIYAILTDSRNKFYVFPTWMYIKDKMNESNFTSLVKQLLEFEIKHVSVEKISDDEPIERENYLNNEYEAYLYSEVWRTAPDELKRSTMKNILCYVGLFKKPPRVPLIKHKDFRGVGFLSTVLMDATFEERNAFWHKNWSDLIEDTRSTDLHRIMNLCFRNECDITQFKQTVMSKYENIGAYCVQMLELGYFNKSDDLLSFCCPETSIRRELKQHLLRYCFLGDNSVLNTRHLVNSEIMNEFIDDAYDNPDQAAEFKKQLASSPKTKRSLSRSIFFGHFFDVMKFVKTFVSNDQIIMQMKKSFVDILKSHLIADTVSKLNAESLQKFLVWCLGNDVEVTKFKQSISVSGVLYRMVENQKPSKRGNRTPASIVALRYPLNLDEFLSWYFNTFEEIEEFKKEFRDVFELFSSI